MASLREIMLELAPPQYRDGEGAAFIFTNGTMLDASFEWTRIGIQARFPSYLSDDVLSEIGRDRVITRGFAEPAEVYAERLRRWLDEWIYAGNPYAIIRQLRYYCYPHEFDMRIANNGGSWYTLTDAGVNEFELGNGNWDWDDEPGFWCRFWAILYPPDTLWDRLPDIGDPTLWDGSIGNPGFTIGSTATPQQVTDVKSIVNTWKDTKSRHMYAIVSFDPGLFDPGDTQPPNPDGTWKHHSKVSGGVRSIARSTDAIYWPGAKLTEI